MSKATPGPWRYDPKSDHASPLIYGPNGEEVVAVHIGGWDEESWFKTSDEDGYLLAAAPDLLAACEKALAYFDYCVMSCDEDESVPEADALRAAIAKAKGEE